MFPSNTVTSLYIVYNLSGKKKKNQRSKGLYERSGSGKSWGVAQQEALEATPVCCLGGISNFKPLFLYCFAIVKALAVLSKELSPLTPSPSQISYPAEDGVAFQEDRPWAVQVHPLSLCNTCVNQKCQKRSFYVIDVSQILFFFFFPIIS